MRGAQISEQIYKNAGGRIYPSMESFSNPAFVLKSVKNVVFEDRPIAALGPKEVRVNVSETGICGSDVHYWQRGRIGKFILEEGTDMVLGHESSGVVVETGSEVPNLKIGDRVAIEPGVPCRYCAHCRDGKYNHCEDMVFAATPPWDGTLAKYYNVAYDYCYKIPDHMDMEEAALVEPVAVAVQICKRAQIQATDSVLVFGCGPIGLLCQPVAKAYACKKVIGLEPNHVFRWEFLPLVPRAVLFRQEWVASSFRFLSPKRLSNSSIGPVVYVTVVEFTLMLLNWLHLEKSR